MPKSVYVDENELKQLRRSHEIVKALDSCGSDYKVYHAGVLKHVFLKDEFDKLIESFADEILQVCSEEADVEYPAGRECGHNVLLGDAQEPVEKLLARLIGNARAIEAEYN